MRLDMTLLNRLGRRNADYRATFGTEHGQRVFRDLCALFGAARSSHVPGDPMSTAFNEGQRRVVLHLSAMLGQSADDLMRLASQGNPDPYREDER